MATQFPLKRIVTSEDVASAVEALATTLRFNTGNNIVIDGGKLL
jgi:NAD(P)-dependent dehydrogenase (short-subunit alcohol dehydrogenase family)